ncbi:uronyl 2-sulfotransferase-like [Centruroides vittatus]|uniref:uronyl 2-sulfotransferase-like n=1 Tax=Centruroides vittatus TaxID=120091 RepID=UPI0035109524
MGKTSSGGRESTVRGSWSRLATGIFLAGASLYAVFTLATLPVYRSDGHGPLGGCDCLPDPATGGEEIRPDGGRLLYNRVPKCASTTLYTLMRKLSVLNRYVHYNSKVYDKKMIDLSEQSRFVRRVADTPAPCSFDRHIFFVNFTRFGRSPPVYINLIRDPVERIISSYYYRRLAARNSRGKTGKPSSYWLNKKFRHCVANADPECSFVDGQSYGVLLLPYFCGQDERCLILNHPWALRTAKSNMERYYAVVGVVEEMNVTLRVLEATLPVFFKGAWEVYHNLSVRKNQNRQKEHVSEDLKAALRANLTSEYELYHFRRPASVRAVPSTATQPRHVSHRRGTWDVIAGDDAFPSRFRALPTDVVCLH